MTAGFAIFRERDFTLFLFARFFSSIAAQMIVIAVGWQVYRITGQLLDLGLIGLSQFLPFLCFALFAGHVADTHERRVVMMLCFAVFLACAALLFAFARAGAATVWPIFLVLALLGVTRAFLSPAAQSFLPNIVPVSALGRALAINSSTFQVASIAGPSIGGLVYAFGESRSSTGAQWVYGSAAALLAGGLIMLSLIKHRRTARNSTAPSWSDLLEGLRFTWRRKTVLGAMSLDLFAVLFGGAAALLPAFTRDVLHAGPAVFGYLRAAPGVGAVTMALCLAARPIRRRVGLFMFTGVAIFGVSTVVLGLTHRLWLALGALALMGSGDMVSVYIRGLLVQLETPDAIRGRVSAVNSVCIGASNELGEFESGFTAAWFGLVPAIVLGGGVTLLVAVLWAGVFFPMLWRLQSFEQLKEHRSDEQPT
ncbi:MAG TPA: MFS transporter [Steroidobacteraceae bacterium]|nr:MFS transporter [Steroidobacteraceae bacterium]